MSTEKPKVYLAGPVDNATDGGHAWRDRLERKYSDMIEFLNPLDKYDLQVENVRWLQPDEIEEDYSDDIEVYHPQTIISHDKGMIDEADYVLVGLREMVPMYGTPREHEYAVQTDTPVVVWYKEEMQLSPWTIGDSLYLSINIEDCIQYIISDDITTQTRRELISQISEAMSE